MKRWGSEESRRAPLLAVVVCLPLLTAGAVHAQTPGAQPEPGPGVDPALQLRELLRERERLEERGPRPEEPELDIPELVLPDLEDETVEFLLREIRFSPTELLDEQWLTELAEEYIGEVVSFGQVNELVERINSAYAKQGDVTARAFVPPQQIVDGRLQILLVEARIGSVAVEGAEHTEPRYIRGRIPLEEGEVLRVPDLRASVREFNRREALQAGVALRPGEAFGESDVVLQMLEPPRLRYQLFADNAGARSTGEERIGGMASWYSPFGRADRFTAFLVGSSGATALDLSYATPVGHRGAALTARLAYNEIEIVRGPLRDLDIEGESLRGSLRYTHPLAWSERRTWDAVGSLGYVRSKTELDGVTFADNEVTRVDAGVRLRQYGQPGPHTHFLEVEQRLAHAHFRESAGELDETDDSLLWDGRLLWEQRLPRAFYTLSRAEWQYADSPEAVLSPQLFQVGGAFDVRGYPQGATAGESGYYLSLELRYAGFAAVEPFVFVDHGGVRQEDQDNERLTSWGAGAFLDLGRGFSGSLTVGVPASDVLPDQDDYRIHFRIAWQGQR
ncbi:ShlB/FhaC/HecB family hemolysin secretion/activation protein [Alkalilimnicola ehrlichii MLHE-1]|uniref:Polypeptide-transport-associated domain protein, ShlB-type n=1 Tax=Alkalilimnicola ehrlichii (strain ATCC BAA-1101 / DSM 17681 / MLHE-1) TaxID=187272 RepID=Q0A9T6_ALKEH|nr:ShlB/FhaC/HecB family hemolysin secretion/activation protein [Alkalilimnicola ehrlichii]ABI56401.1 Polypeptide-transport-associated domain protein, ShlB-type [Alkalilimnicola ehrlichii MLHE-1]